MKSIVIYGSTTGNTEAAAAKIADKLGADCLAAGSFEQGTPAEYDLIVLGASTWGAGDLQDDWEAALPALASAELNGKKVALFGLGDQEGYSDTFVDGIGALYDTVIEAEAVVVGMTATDGYDFTASTAVRDGKFVGLVLDEDNQSALSDARISDWVAELLE